MATENVEQYLKDRGYPLEIIIFDQLIATVAQAANQLNCNEEDIAKTMAFDVNGQPIVIVVAGDKRIDNAKYRHTFLAKAKMVAPDLLEDFIGHPMGGVCPFACKENVKVYLDESLKKFEFVYPAAGSVYSAVKMYVSEFEKYCDISGWVDVCK